MTKKREDKARRLLQKMGLALRKSRAGSWSYDDQQGYMIADISTNAVVQGGRFELSLEDVEEFINQAE